MSQQPPQSPRASAYRIVRIGSPQTGWAIERDGIITRSHPSAELLGAYLDAIAGANEFDASDIAKVIERRPWPSYEERMTVFSPTGS
jgi:hypothetical protein